MLNFGELLINENQNNEIFTSQIFNNTFIIGFYDADRVLLTFYTVNKSAMGPVHYANLGSYFNATQARYEQTSFALTYSVKSKNHFAFLLVKAKGLIRFEYNFAET